MGSNEDIESQQAIKKLKTAIREKMNRDEAPGLVFSISTSKEIVAAGSFWNDKYIQNLDHFKSKFRIASVAKFITGMGVMTLIEQERLKKNDLLLEQDTPFIKRFRSLLTKKQESVFSKITVSHLASHLAGISKEVPGARIWTQQSQIADGAYPSIDKFWAGVIVGAIIVTLVIIFTRS